MIVIDQRGCGQGKTTDGIYKRIRANKQNNIKSLVVVPSLKLQEQYKKDLDLIAKVKSDVDYKKYISETPVPLTEDRQCEYVTNSTANDDIKNNLLNIYSSVNSNQEKGTYNGKVKLN
mgnify:CR=1 FL=1